MNTLRLIFVSTLNTYSLISTPEAEKIYIRAGYLFFITKYTAFSIAISRENPQIFRLRRGNPLFLAGKNFSIFRLAGKNPEKTPPHPGGGYQGCFGKRSKFPIRSMVSTYYFPVRRMPPPTKACCGTHGAQIVTKTCARRY